MKKQNGNQNVKDVKVAVLVKAFDHYHNKFSLFQLSCKIVKEFRPKFNKFDFTNHGFLHSAVWKALHNVEIKRAEKARHNQFFF